MIATQRRPIKLLPEHLIDQIKAGEVIERPSMVIKELVENSLDAGADHINIHLINNGLDLIGVEDNGQGMSLKELPHAFCRHATSKLERFEHLYKLLTYGFRGEALASIASVSRTRCLSSPSENPQEGGKLDINGGVQEKPVPWSSEKSGTSLYIKDLFYNTPARLKFIKSTVSEKNSLKRTLESLMLANPQVAFSLKWDDKDRQFYAPVDPENMGERVAELFFKNRERADRLLPFSQAYGSMKTNGFLSTVSSRGNSGKHHFILANGRTIYDPQLHKIILNKAESLWPAGEKGHYFVRIDVSEEDIDVNIHPNKTKVKFFQAAEVLALVSAAVDQVCTPAQPTLPLLPDPPLASPPPSTSSFSPTLSSFPSPSSQPRPLPGDSPRTSFGKKHLSSWEDTSLIKITSNIYLVPDNPYRIMRADRLLLQFLRWGLSRPVTDENDLLPLLIGEPFPEKSLAQQGIEFFSGLGFRLEKVGSVLSLNTIPKWCEGTSPSLLMPPLFEWYRRYPDRVPDHLPGISFEFPADTLASSLLPALRAISPDRLEQLGVLATPSEQDWEALFPS